MSGTTEAEVLELERALGKRLPGAYRDYLLRSGHDESGPLRGTDCFIRHVLDNNKWLPELLAENGVRWTLPERYVCFFMHQGYVAAWFDLDDPSPDPKSWCYEEGVTLVPEVRGTFSSVMRAEVEAGRWDMGRELSGPGRAKGTKSAMRAYGAGGSERRKSRISGSRSTPSASATRLM